MESAHAHRKDEHLALSEAEYRQQQPVSSLKQVRLIHNSLPEINIADVSLAVRDEKFNFTTPFYIEAMTGGSNRTGKINQQLAQVARQTGIAMAVGSQSVALKDSDAIESFTVARQTNPDGFIMANIGAGHHAKAAQQVVDMIGANALEVHLNVPQEIVMPEGDAEFIWLDNIADIIQTVNVPVIIKEVGFGMSAETIQTLYNMGAEYVNIGGRSGTNFVVIEDRRNREQHKSFDFLYDWGQTTAESLLEAQSLTKAPIIFATGGVQDPLDILKAQIMGAKAVGVAGHFLHTVLQAGPEGLVDEILNWQRQLKKLYALVGAKSADDLANVPYILSSELLNYKDQRHL
ncbi:type 2 isopentenyl-diphosphate Delta-isomerase [Weissella hellenica]|nr:type 2 isopentenyl-diphosphate Delta-isomerase [Weissella hellenica]